MAEKDIGRLEFGEYQIDPKTEKPVPIAEQPPLTESMVEYAKKSLDRETEEITAPFDSTQKALNEKMTKIICNVLNRKPEDLCLLNEQIVATLDKMSDPFAQVSGKSGFNQEKLEQSRMEDEETVAKSDSPHPAPGRGGKTKFTGAKCLSECLKPTEPSDLQNSRVRMDKCKACGTAVEGDPIAFGQNMRVCAECGVLMHVCLNGPTVSPNNITSPCEVCGCKLPKDYSPVPQKAKNCVACGCEMVGADAGETTCVKCISKFAIHCAERRIDPKNRMNPPAGLVRCPTCGIESFGKDLCLKDGGSIECFKCKTLYHVGKNDGSCHAWQSGPTSCPLCCLPSVQGEGGRPEGLHKQQWEDAIASEKQCPVCTNTLRPMRPVQFKCTGEWQSVPVFTVRLYRCGGCDLTLLESDKICIKFF